MIDKNTFLTLITILNYLFIIWLIFERKRSYRFLIFWILFFLAVPVLSWLFFFIYHILFEHCFQGYQKIYQTIEKACDEQITQYVEPLPNKEMKERYRKIISLNYHLTGNQICINNEAKIYDRVEDYYQSLFKIIDTATKTIYIEMYIIQNDQIGKDFIDLLAHKAQQGVKVILLYDQCGSKHFKKISFQKFLACRGEIYSYFRRTPKGILINFNFRNHRKLVIVDSKIAFLGGVNIGEEYISNHLKITPWRDTQISLKGEIILYLIKQFFVDYYFCLYQRSKIFKIQLDINDFLFEKVNHFLPLQVVSSSFHQHDARISQSIKNALISANKTIKIQTPYFVPDTELLELLTLLLNRGVQIMLMVPKVYDQRIPYRVTMYYVELLRQKGAKIYLYHGFIHSKVTVIDDDILIIGSSNMDIRSLRYNYEINACFISKVEVAKYNTILCKDINNSEEYTIDVYKSLNTFKKIEEKIYLLFSQMM